MGTKRSGDSVVADRRGSIKFILGAIVLLALAVFAGWTYFKPSGDKLCEEVRHLAFLCPTLIADPITWRPGGVTKEVVDSTDDQFKRVEPPNSYLDNATCLIPGAKLAPWTPEPKKTFTLPSITYTFDAITRFGRDPILPMVQGVQINEKAAVSRISKISIRFGAARTRLLDENFLLNRIEDCAISRRCVKRIKDSGYEVINRVLEVDGMSYTFQDSRGAKLPLRDLVDENIITSPGGGFNVQERAATSLITQDQMVIGVTAVNPAELAKVHPCTKDVVYSSDGSSTVVIGGGGERGHINDMQPVTASLGSTAELSARGHEDKHGNFEKIVSFAKGVATIKEVAPNTLDLISEVSLHGGHWGVRGPLGIGIVSGHDTNANAEASIDGRVNVLVRTSGAELLVEWANFPSLATASGVHQLYRILVDGPMSSIGTIQIKQSSGQRKFHLPAEGMYTVAVRAIARVTGNGRDARSVALKATVRAQVLPSK